MGKKGGNKDKGKKGKKQGHELFNKEEKWVNPTPEGQKKDFSAPMDDKYEPQKVEASWDAWWSKQGYYAPAAKGTENKDNTFTIVIPPPNVTGTLHLGHALTCSVEDALVRWHRMQGKDVLWVPGFDHAGIATQVVVEKKVWKDEKLTRHDLGREKFLERVWKWTEENGTTITRQLRRLGASVDWGRKVFTMDEKRGDAVTEAFVRMFKDGYIYRSNRLVNWSCQLKTAISSIEVDHREFTGATQIKVPGYENTVEVGAIHDFAYKVKGTDDYLIVSTTRIETMLGDVAVAVHPDDDRYTKYHGKELEHPFVPDRKVVVITDAELVKMEFGTGCVKVTPAHDPNDFACGQRNNLPQINILDDYGCINENGGKYKGMKRFDVRRQIIEDMKELGLYKGKKDNPMQIGFCSRSKDIVEPVIRPQWWVNCSSLAARGVKAVKEGDLKIIPDQFKPNWYHWLEDCQDWCISRQLWWGHRIPAYWVDITEEEAGVAGRKDEDVDPRWIVARTQEAAEKEAAEKFANVPKDRLVLKQDEDVLDTWFSSGLFPFSVMEWPNETEDMKRFYPNNLLETGHDILFFWVARMVMMGFALTDQLPFSEVYLHAMVRDKLGRKMSKSLGNVLDPIDVINGIDLQSLHDKLHQGNLPEDEIKVAQANQKKEFPGGIAECGADALRFGLLNYTTQARDINLDALRIVGYRQFCNKLWQATKFALMKFPDDFKPPSFDSMLKPGAGSKSLADQWILSRLSHTIEQMDTAFTNYDFAAATNTIYAFWVKELCAVFLEVTKPTFSGDDENQKTVTRNILWTCYEIGLRLLHPLMPFVTEELYHRIPGAITDTNPSIMKAAYPKHQGTECWRSDDIESAMNIALDIASAGKSLRGSFNLTSTKLDIFIKTNDDETFNVVTKYTDEITTMAVASSIKALKSSDKVPEKCISSVANAQCSIFVPCQGLVNFDEEMIKIDRKIQDALASYEKAEARTSSAGFAKANEKVRAKELEKMENLKQELDLQKLAFKKYQDLLSPEENKEVEQKILTSRHERVVTKKEKLIASAEAELAKSTKKLAAAQAEVVGGKDKDKAATQQTKIERLEKTIGEKSADLTKMKEELEQIKKDWEQHDASAVTVNSSTEEKSSGPPQTTTTRSAPTEKMFTPFQLIVGGVVAGVAVGVYYLSKLYSRPNSKR